MVKGIFINSGNENKRLELCEIHQRWRSNNFSKGRRIKKDGNVILIDCLMKVIQKIGTNWVTLLRIENIVLFIEVNGALRTSHVLEPCSSIGIFWYFQSRCPWFKTLNSPLPLLQIWIIKKKKKKDRLWDWVTSPWSFGSAWVMWV